ncbi:MAG: hypothetical protein J1F71_01120 [Clostridiales bacterium]|nr:hypothetical protein [Clostridiales bacterium]
MSNISERIAKMIENDEDGTVKRTLKVAQSDIFALLSDYMDVKTLDVAADRTDDGYVVKITAHVNRIFGIGNTSDNY